MFLAGKVEETPRPLKDVILVSYEIIHKKDPAAVQRIKQKEVYEQQKELILLGERVVLATLAFDFNMHHPYKPLVEAIKKFKVAQNALAQVAWNFVNDGLRTSLCLQFNPHHIAAGAIFLAAKFLKVKLPSDGDKVWWQEFDVTPRQLEEVSNQMLELYEQNRTAPSNNVEGTAGGGNQKASTFKDEAATTNSNLYTGAPITRYETSKPTISKIFIDSTPNHVVHPVSGHGKHGFYGSTETKLRAEDDAKGIFHLKQEPAPHKENLQEAQEMVRSQSGSGKEQKINVQSGDLNHRDAVFTRPPQEAIIKIDRDKVKAALEKRKKASDRITKRTEIMDEDDLIEREIEDGIELASSQTEKNKQDKVQQDKVRNWSKALDRSDYENMQHGKQPDHAEEHLQGLKVLPSCETDRGAVEEGEVSSFHCIDFGVQSPKSSNNKRKAGSSPNKEREGKKLHNYSSETPHHSRFDHIENRNKLSGLGHADRDSKRHVQENHI
ncbi:cyclin-T1-3-like isoform X2 [Cicer arietinum]|nr:cyclin-T1-5-like isoform X2 [Cicer arietinum]